MSIGASSSRDDHAGHQPSPRWPAILALLAIGCLYLLMSDRVSFGPPWLTLTVIIALLIPLNVAHRRGAPIWARRFALMVTAAVTVAVGVSALLIVYDAVLGRGIPGAASVQRYPGLDRQRPGVRHLVLGDRQRRPLPAPSRLLLQPGFRLSSIWPSRNSS